MSLKRKIRISVETTSQFLTAITGMIYGVHERVVENNETSLTGEPAWNVKDKESTEGCILFFCRGREKNLEFHVMDVSGLPKTFYLGKPITTDVMDKLVYDYMIGALS